jgi:hypothetical protein
VALIVREGHKVRVRILVPLSSRTANVGDVFDGEVAEEVEVDGRVVVARGAPALGTVTAVQRAGYIGRAGRLGFTFDYTRTVDGQKVRLRASQERAQQGSEVFVWGVALFLFWPALFIKGAEMDIQPGTTFNAFIDRDTVVQVPVLVPDIRTPSSPVPPPPPSP